jgi:hypothetical protein
MIKDATANLSANSLVVVGLLEKDVLTLGHLRIQVLVNHALHVVQGATQNVKNVGH